MTDITSIQYEAMQRVADSLDQESARIERALGQVMNHLGTLKGGGWIADAATQMYREMDNDVCPAIRKLQAALQQASGVSRQIAKTLSSADEEACNCLPAE